MRKYVTVEFILFQYQLRLTKQNDAFGGSKNRSKVAFVEALTANHYPWTQRHIYY